MMNIDIELETIWPILYPLDFSFDASRYQAGPEPLEAMGHLVQDD